MNPELSAQFLVTALAWLTLIPVVCGGVFSVLCWVAVRFGLRRVRFARLPDEQLPAVTVLKPVCGLEKGLEENLHSICQQDYPNYQVVMSLQDPADSARELLEKIQDQYGADRVSLVVAEIQAGLNGKINNMLGGMRAARHDVLVISDSDVKLRADYLRTLISPLDDPEVGAVCTLFRATRADTWFEKLELLSINADFIPSVVFAHLTGASGFCLGPSVAFRRQTLEEIGGFESLADYLVEDYEIGRRVWTSGKRMDLVPYMIDKVVDLANVKDWWDHQVYWDQNTRSARPAAFFATIVTRAVPFSLLYAALRGFDGTGLVVLLATVALRTVTGAATVSGLGDREGRGAIWLLPLRDVLGLVSFVLAYTRRTVIWRGRKFILTLHGRLEPVDGTNPPGVRPEERQPAAADPDSPVVGAESLVAAEDERSENMRADARGGGKSWSSISALLAAAFLR